MMPARLILARHGNTFRPDQMPVWVGAPSDLPLVEKGLAQATALGEALKAAGLAPVAVSCGDLQRTRRTAEIAAEIAGFPAARVAVDPRLTEIDYGVWEGKASPEIEAAGFAAELAEWNKNSIYPTSAGWKPAEAQLLADTASVLADAPEGLSLIVSSNGVLRFFARHAVNADAFPDRKVGTGNVCVMTRDAQGDWRIERWNQPPAFCFQQNS